MRPRQGIAAMVFLPPAARFLIPLQYLSSHKRSIVLRLVTSENLFQQGIVLVVCCHVELSYGILLNDSPLCYYHTKLLICPEVAK